MKRFYFQISCVFFVLINLGPQTGFANSRRDATADPMSDPALAISTAPGGWPAETRRRLLEDYKHTYQQIQGPDLTGTLKAFHPEQMLKRFVRGLRDLYQYPYNNKLISTISAALVREREADERPIGPLSRQPMKFTFFPERSEHPYYGGFNHANVTFTFSSAEAPLVVVLGGLGADSDGNMTSYLTDQLQEWGFNVLALPNVFDWSFGLAISSSGTPGITSDDAADLNRLMQESYKNVRERFGLKPSRFILAGYSMGGFHTLKMAEQNYQLDRPFDRYLMINAPIDLLYGISALDKMSARADELNIFEKSQSLAHVVGATLRLKFRDINSPDYYSDLDMWFGLADQKLEYVIGVLMSTCIADTLLMVNEMGSRKVLKGQSYIERLFESRKWYITDYMKEMVFPRLEERAAQMGLEFTELLARETDVRRWQVPKENLAKVRYLHNMDDFIVAQDQLPELEQIFGENARIFPLGGHMGNVWYPDNVKLIRAQLER